MHEGTCKVGLPPTPRAEQDEHMSLVAALLPTHKSELTALTSMKAGRVYSGALVSVPDERPSQFHARKTLATSSGTERSAPRVLNSVSSPATLRFLANTNASFSVLSSSLWPRTCNERSRRELRTNAQ